jgi:hypothetical protein
MGSEQLRCAFGLARAIRRGRFMVRPDSMEMSLAERKEEKVTKLKSESGGN